MNGGPLLKVTDLSKAFGGVRALNRVSFDHFKKETFSA